MYSGAGPFLKPKVALWPGGEGGLPIFLATAGFPKVALWPVGVVAVMIDFSKITMSRLSPLRLTIRR
jgi:hypothetical protein